MMQIRPLRESDNKSLSKLIKSVFEEYDIAKEGTVYSDPTTDDLFSLFNIEGAVYWVAEEEGVLLGGCGIFPTTGLPQGYGELVKLYLSPASRGKGIGKLLMAKSIESAKNLGYSTLYLESFPELNKAISIYEKIGFKSLKSSLGQSGHYACTLWMAMDL